MRSYAGTNHMVEVNETPFSRIVLPFYFSKIYMLEKDKDTHAIRSDPGCNGVDISLRFPTLRYI